MKASTPAKGSGKRPSAGKASSRPARRPPPKAKKTAAAAKQATATRRVPAARPAAVRPASARPKAKASAKPAAKRSAAAASKSTAARRRPASRPAPKSAATKRPTVKAPPRKPAVKASVARAPAAAVGKPRSTARTVAPQGKRASAAPKQIPPKPAAPKVAAKPKAEATKPVPADRKPVQVAAAPRMAAVPPPKAPAVPAPPPVVAAAKPKPPPRSEAGSSAEAPVRIAAPLVTPSAPTLAQPSDSLAAAPSPATAVRPSPSIGGAGLARAHPHTHFIARRDAPPIQPPQTSAMPVEFKSGDHVVYPTHGVGTVQGIETMSAAGYALQVIVVTFDENRMTLRVPVGKAMSSGLRKLASGESMTEALDTLRGRARVKRTMWSRRAQEYEAKINSGDPVQIAEVVRDLHRNSGQPDQSFSERQIYEQALDRLAAELAAIDRSDKQAATEKLLEHLNAA
jgi:CarD family transcriptional regulator